MWGMLHSVSRADFIRTTIQNLEFYMKTGFEQSQIHGPGARQFVILFDMKDFNLKQYTWRPGTYLFSILLGCMDCLSVRVCAICIFQILWNMRFFKIQIAN